MKVRYLYQNDKGPTGGEKLICTIKAKVGTKFDMSEMVPASGGYTCLADFKPEFIDLCGKTITPGYIAGEPAKYTFTFLPRKPGTTHIHLVVARYWQGGDVSNVVSYEILIS